MPQQLALILVTHNSTRWLPAFFETWNIAARNVPHEILIADSGSTDDTSSVAAGLSPAAKIIRCENIGFGAAANRAGTQSNAPLLLVCNPDLTFAPDSLLALTRAASEFPHAAVIAPRLFNSNGTVQPSVGKFPAIRGILADQFRPRENRKYIHPQPDAACKIDWATGACLLFRRDAFLAVSGFDEKFFLYAEEVDLLRRMKSAGHETWFFPAAQVTHHAPAATRNPNPQLQLYAARGLLRYFARHGSLFQLSAYRALAFASRRLPKKEAFAPLKKILESPTGP